MPKTMTKPKGSRKPTAEEYRVLAEYAEGQETEQRKQDRRTKAKRAAGVPAKRWATNQNTKVAGKQEAAARKEAKQQQATRPSGDQLWEQRRHALIRDRNRRRRLPWYGPLASVGVGLAGHGVVSLFAATTSVPVSIPAGVFAGILAVATLAFAASHERRYQQRVTLADRQHLPDEAAPKPTHRKWALEVFAGGAGCAALTYWIALAGVSWPVVLAILLGTIACGWRWWKHNPIGPGVSLLQPPRPKQPEPEPQPEKQAPQDDYASMWSRYNANKNRGGKAPGSRLANRDDDEYVTTFDAELLRGVQTPNTLRLAIAELASGLAIRASRLMIEDDPAERGEHIAKVTIVRHDPVADIRYYTGPTVTATPIDGIVHGTGRYGDGHGELDITMWNDAGMVPTAIIGATRSGKSCVGNIAVDGMLSTGVMNMLYIDPKTISSPEMASVSRVAILGEENSARAPELIKAIVAARKRYGALHRMAKMNPTSDLPGWGIVHDEFSELVNNGYRKEAMQWTSLVNTVAAFGMWPVAMNQSMLETKWGDDQCRGAFATQMVVMRMRTYSGKLIPGLELHPATLPNRKGIGVYVHDDGARSNVPVQFDYVPEPKEVHKHPDAPLTTGSAFARHAQPDLLDMDYEAIVSVLGLPNEDGRWVVGGAFGTHEFPSLDDKGGKTPAASQKPSGGWGAKLAEAAGVTTENRLTDSQRRVYQVIEGGTTRAGDIESACDTLGRSTVQGALSDLVGMNLIYRPEGRRGEYAVADSTSESV